MRYITSENIKIDFDEIIKKKTTTVYMVGNKCFDNKKEAKQYVIDTMCLEEEVESKFKGYMVLCDFTLDEDIDEPELFISFEAYESDLELWISMLEDMVRNRNRREGYETQDGRSIKHILKLYKLNEEGKEDLIYP